LVKGSWLKTVIASDVAKAAKVELLETLVERRNLGWVTSTATRLRKG
jgi:hypothetical protein